MQSSASVEILVETNERIATRPKLKGSRRKKPRDNGFFKIRVGKAACGKRLVGLKDSTTNEE